MPDLSAGLYVLEAGAEDPQSPHGEDELYYVVVGPCPGHGRRGDPRRRARDHGVRRPRTCPHRFHDIAERLELLVVFGPAEGSRG